jgi:hypothetical protein
MSNWRYTCILATTRLLFVPVVDGRFLLLLLPLLTHSTQSLNSNCNRLVVVDVVAVMLSYIHIHVHGDGMFMVVIVAVIVVVVVVRFFLKLLKP